jgi:polyphosphate kinase
MQRNLENRVEVLVPVEDPELQAALRTILDTLLSDSHSAWQMNADGSYEQLEGKDSTVESSQQALIDQAADRLREATRLKRRKPQGARRRNIRH